MAQIDGQELKATPLTGVHRAAGARLVAFAGYAMPLHYDSGILAEHAWTREHAGLFDVSHMGQAAILAGSHGAAAAALEGLVGADIAGLPAGRQRYSQLLNAEGGIVDDLMIARPDDPARDGELLLVVNAATKEAVCRRLSSSLPPRAELHRLDDRALLALQGPEAAAALAGLAPEVAGMAFMDSRALDLPTGPAQVSRSGYTGEDGFEISCRAEVAADLWSLLLADGRVRPIGLGARDSLRLEAGLPLCGHDLNQETSPVEAGLAWSLGKVRRERGDVPGHLRIARELADGPVRRRVGIRIDGRVPAREGAEILDEAGQLIGKVTSGGFGPSVGGPVAMGYVVSDFAEPGTPVGIAVRGRVLSGRVVPLPFWPHRFKR